MKAILKVSLSLLILFTGVKYVKAQPKLVVGIVVDQMRYDFIERFSSKFSANGFNRIINEGASYTNAHHDYVPTFTGPGHASIFTGAYPSEHGIVGNEWIDVQVMKRVYCVGDKSVQPVGTIKGSGKMSPRNLEVSTFADDLHAFTNGEAKILAASLKDRGAVIAAGKNGDAAYWYESTTGDWISSSYYMKALPVWVNNFNKKGLAVQYLQNDWSLLRELKSYDFGESDESPCEAPFKGSTSTSFPYPLAKIRAGGKDMGLLKSTPFGNTFTAEFARELVLREELGKDSICDFLAISFSSTDYIGHQFGPSSVEVEDAFLRLDQDLAALLEFLDERIGKNNLLVFLTSDHGAAEAVPCALNKQLPAGVIDQRTIVDSLRNFYLRTYRDTFFLVLSEFDIYLREDRIAKKGLQMKDVKEASRKYLEGIPGVYRVYHSEMIRDSSLSDTIIEKVRKGYYKNRSGDLILVLEPNWLMGYHLGTTHGSPYQYDSHVPLMLWGAGVGRKVNSEFTSITQLSLMLKTNCGIRISDKRNGDLKKVESKLNPLSPEK